jgi:hypothetical protein
MSDIKLQFGAYLTPITVVGATLECEVRGLVTVCGMSNGPLPWPLGERDGEQHLIVFKGLSRAIRQERPEAVAEHWGIPVATVVDWKKACNGPRYRRKQTIKLQPIPWKPQDDELVCRLPLEEAARMTGHTLTAVRKRRRVLGLPDARFTANRPAPILLEKKAAEVASNVRYGVAQLSQSVGALKLTFQASREALMYWKEHDSQKSKSGFALRPADGTVGASSQMANPQGARDITG